MSCATAGFNDAVEIIFLISDVKGEGLFNGWNLSFRRRPSSLGCTPVINLFPQIAEPIQLNQRKYEYASHS